MGHRRSTILLLFLTLAVLCATSSEIYGQDWKLSWSDEFNGAKRSGIDRSKWEAQTGGDGWGNRELEYYTAGQKNAYHNGRGSLVIRALEETLSPEFKCWYGPCLYTSARLYTKKTFKQAYGRFEARIKLPHGQGIWPAFWLLGSDIDAVGWPACGEIDIMENIGREPALVHGTLHGPGYSGDKGIGAPYNLKQGGRFADAYHTYSVEWEPAEIRWYVDGNLYQAKRPADLPSGARWVYDHPFFIILNLAVGGAWPGNPDATTVFPQEMLIDYVRVYQRAKTAR